MSALFSIIKVLLLEMINENYYSFYCKNLKILSTFNAEYLSNQSQTFNDKTINYIGKHNRTFKISTIDTLAKPLSSLLQT